MDWTTLQNTILRFAPAIGFFVFIMAYFSIKKVLKYLLTFNYKHDKESLKASREFVKFQK